MSHDQGGTPYDRVSRVVVECIGRMGSEQGLWRVGLEFTDGTVKPEGMFTDVVTARSAAEDLANAWGCAFEERALDA